jgi:myo-inositol-1-phosphate synthase
MAQGTQGKLGIAVVGLGGAVATTAAAGVELLRLGLAGTEGLPLAETGRAADLVAYDDLVLAGWDVCGDDLATAAEGHGVLGHAELAAAAPALSAITPWPAVGNADFCRKVDGDNQVAAAALREAVAAVQADLRRFRDEAGVDEVVVVNLASTERAADPADPALASLEGLEAALDADDPVVSPAVLYAYAAVAEGIPYANFTPSVAADAPALVELALRAGVPTAGKDGKTGQTMLKTVLAPALRARALRVEGWYSANLLGNRDGQALDDPESLRSKLGTKADVLDSCLGYEVADHLVRIDFYRPRGDAKEAWDAIDVVGFLGQRMQLKVDLLARDSILAAPLVLEIARVLQLAGARGEAGPQEQLGAFFKAPTTADGSPPEHALHRQQERLLAWLDGPPSAPRAPSPAPASARR